MNATAAADFRALPAVARRWGGEFAALSGKREGRSTTRRGAGRPYLRSLQQRVPVE